MPNMHAFLRHQYSNLLILGVILLCWGVVSTCIGETLAPHAGRVISRAEEPREFWKVVAMYYVICVWFVGYFLYKFYQ
jgi:hypothetical protein